MYITHRTGDATVAQQLMKHYEHWDYLSPTIRICPITTERGFGASLEIPVVDPEQGWSMRPADETIEE